MIHDLSQVQLGLLMWCLQNIQGFLTRGASKILCGAYDSGNYTLLIDRHSRADLRIRQKQGGSGDPFRSLFAIIDLICPVRA